MLVMLKQLDLLKVSRHTCNKESCISCQNRNHFYLTHLDALVIKYLQTQLKSLQLYYKQHTIFNAVRFITFVQKISTATIQTQPPLNVQEQFFV